jgi:hypothetical protein
MRAGMHQRIVKYEIAALGQGRNQCRIGGKACTKKQSALQTVNLGLAVSPQQIATGEAGDAK